MDATITEKIKSLGDDYDTGSALVDLMDYYKVNNLACITQKQAEQFYEYYKIHVKMKKVNSVDI